MERIKVIVADSDPKVQEHFTESLIDPIFEKTMAHNGQECLQIYKDFQPHIIISEMKLPQITGYAILKEMRTKFNDYTTGFVLMGKDLDPAQVQLCEDLGILGTLNKPFDPKMLGIKTIEWNNNRDSAHTKEYFEAFKLYYLGLQKLNAIDIVARFSKLTPQKDEMHGTVPIKGYMELVIVKNDNRGIFFPKLGKLGNIYTFISLVKGIKPNEALEFLAPDIKKP